MQVNVGCMVADLADNKRTLQEALAEVERETNLRVRLYPGWVKDRKISSLEAHERLERLAKAGQILEELYASTQSTQADDSKSHANEAF